MFGIVLAVFSAFTIALCLEKARMMMSVANVKVTYDDGSSVMFPLSKKQAWEVVNMIWEKYSGTSVVDNRLVED